MGIETLGRTSERFPLLGHISRLNRGVTVFLRNLLNKKVINMQPKLNGQISALLDMLEKYPCDVWRH
jgi:hypothetical protein